MDQLLRLKKMLQEVYSISEAEWLLFEPFVEMKTVKKKTLLLKQGDACEYLFILISGALREFTHVNGKDVSIQFAIDRGFSTNLKSILGKRPSHYGIETMLDSEVATFKYAELEKLYKKHDSINRVGRMICEQYIITGVDRALDLVSLDATEKYNKLFAEFGESLNKLPQKYIASYLGVSPVTLSRMNQARTA